MLTDGQRYSHTGSLRKWFTQQHSVAFNCFAYELTARYNFSWRVHPMGVCQDRVCQSEILQHVSRHYQCTAMAAWQCAMMGVLGMQWRTCRHSKNCRQKQTGELSTFGSKQQGCTKSRWIAHKWSGLNQLTYVHICGMSVCVWFTQAEGGWIAKAHCAPFSCTVYRNICKSNTNSLCVARLSSILTKLC